MGLFNRISSKHSLSQAVSIKLNQKCISQKTLDKLGEKIRSIGNARCQGWPVKVASTRASTKFNAAASLKNQIVEIGRASEVAGASHQTPGMGIIKKFLSRSLVDLAIGHANEDLKFNRQPGDVTNIADDALMSAMVDAERKRRPSMELHAMRNTDELASFVMEKKGPWQGQAVVKMARESESNESHFAAIDLRVEEDGSRFLVVYESAFLQGDESAGSNHGLKSLLDAMRVAGRNKNDAPPRIGFVELAIQKSPGDCAIFALSTALASAKQPEISAGLVERMKMDGKNLVYLYDKSGARHILQKDKKLGVVLPANLHKHAHSLSTLGTLETTPVNRQRESVASRGERYRVERDGRSYSNSVERKRLVYYNRAKEILNEPK